MHGVSPFGSHPAANLKLLLMVAYGISQSVITDLSNEYIAMLIDRMPDDNLKKLTIENAS